jgi:glycosyltransferase involved in cell wall biosynthesis
MTGIILSLITKDSAKKLGDVFRRALESSLQVPYRAIILVDDSVDDSTRRVVEDFADRHGKELVVERSRLPPGWHKPTRATARQTAIDIFFERFSDEWIMFLDDDCVLNSGWWSWVEKSEAMANPRVGEIWGINYDHYDDRKRYLESLGRDYVGYLIEQFHLRGGTHDTLYRRKAIEGVEIPPELHWYEDSWLHHYVICGGWDSVINPVGVDHYGRIPRSLKWTLNYLRDALDITFKYGITEYVDDVRKVMRNNRNARNYVALLMKKVLAYAAITPFLIVNQARIEAKAYGVREALVNAFKKYYERVWFKYQILRRTWETWQEPPDPCLVVYSIDNVQQ